MFSLLLLQLQDNGMVTGLTQRGTTRSITEQIWTGARTNIWSIVHNYGSLLDFSFFLAAATVAERCRSLASSSSLLTRSSSAESLSCCFPYWIEPASPTSPSALLLPCISTSNSFPSTCPSRWVVNGCLPGLFGSTSTSRLKF